LTVTVHAVGIDEGWFSGHGVFSALSGALSVEWCVTTHHSTRNAPLNAMVAAGAGMRLEPTQQLKGSARSRPATTTSSEIVLIF
jgi:hypothetical protein